MLNPEIESLRQYVKGAMYIDHADRFERFRTRVVQVGEVAIGGDNPIRVQSMTTTDTMDTMATVKQSIAMIEAGCELVRITAPSLKEAQNLELIKKELRQAGYRTPLIADIHYTPNAAELAARIVEKVRINPGNYIDKKKFEIREYTDDAYAQEVERIRSRFLPLVQICKEYGTAMRIGTNHGSLSDRIMNRYGDTPLGMVESAMEFLRIAADEGYHNIVLSMKASNPQVMIYAYRLLVAKMKSEGMDYPLHLGVTEAGEAAEGRIKSGMGIGALLEDGLGDTIRVSLTEAPEAEIPVAKALATRYDRRHAREQELVARKETSAASTSSADSEYSPFTYSPPAVEKVETLGKGNVPRVVANLSGLPILTPYTLKPLDYHYDPINDKWNMGEQGVDFVYTGKTIPNFMLPTGCQAIVDAEAWIKSQNKVGMHPLLSATLDTHLDLSALQTAQYLFVSVHAKQLLQEIEHLPVSLLGDERLVWILEGPHSEDEHQLGYLRHVRNAILALRSRGMHQPIILRASYPEPATSLHWLMELSADLGGLLCDGLAQGLWLERDNALATLLDAQGKPTLQLINETAFYLLQAARLRISKTEYISCPSCGRTLFDLQETTAMIRQHTDHLKGVKIAIMGCIVNGPGEMADADYGYVGTGPGKISLYKGKEMVKKNIESTDALQELIELIKEGGQWVEKQELVQG